MRRRQVARKVESTEGTAVALTSAEAGILVYEPAASHAVNMFKRTPARASMSPLVQIPGIRTGTISYWIELKGSGTTGTAPSWGTDLKGCGMRELNIVNATLTSGTGTFQHGESVIIGAGPTEAGIVFKDTGPNPASVYLCETNDTFADTDALTGLSSGATGTINGTPTDSGISYWPDSSAGSGDGSSYTIGSYEDGIRKLLRGARGTWGIEANVGEPAFLTFEWQGVEDEVATLALLTGITFEDVTPPKFQNVGFSINDGSAYSPVFGSFSMAFNNVLAARTDANSVEGALSIRITGRGPSGSYDPETVIIATHDFYNNWFNGTTYTMGFTLGTVAGNKVEVYAPTAQSTAVGDGDRTGLALSPVTYGLAVDSINSPGDDEIVIVQWDV